MTRTEDDLRALLRTPVEPAAADRVLTRVRVETGRDRPRTGRALRIGLVTALVLVVVAGAVALVTTVRPARDTTAPPASAPVPATTTTPTTTPTPTPTVGRSDVGAPGPLAGGVVSLLAGSGYDLGTTTLTDGVESVDVVTTGSTTPVGTVRVGDVALTRDGNGPTVDLGNGVSATWAEAGPTADGSLGGRVLAWSVDGLTVVLRPAPGVGDDVTVAAARAVLVGAPEPLAVPVSVAAWPAAGWSVAGLVVTYGPGDDAGPAVLDVRVDLAAPGQAGVAVSLDTTVGGGDATPAGTPVPIAGRTWIYDATSSSLSWAGTDRTVRVASSNAGIDRDTLEDLVAATTLATSVADPSTWFGPGTAFPS